MSPQHSPSLVEAPAFLEQRLEPQRPSLVGARPLPHRAARSPRPTSPASPRCVAAAAWTRVPTTVMRDDGGPVDRAHVAADDRHARLLVASACMPEKSPTKSSTFHARGTATEVSAHAGARALGGEVAERERERAPTGVLGGHPCQVEVHALDRHVGAGDGERRSSRARTAASSPPACSPRYGLMQRQQLELARAADLVITRPASHADGARPPRGRLRRAIARITQTRCRPSAVSCPTLDSSMPPMANTGTLDAGCSSDLQHAFRSDHLLLGLDRRREGRPAAEVIGAGRDRPPALLRASRPTRR